MEVLKVPNLNFQPIPMTSKFHSIVTWHPCTYRTKIWTSFKSHENHIFGIRNCHRWMSGAWFPTVRTFPSCENLKHTVRCASLSSHEGGKNVVAVVHFGRSGHCRRPLCFALHRKDSVDDHFSTRAGMLKSNNHVCIFVMWCHLERRKATASISLDAEQVLSKLIAINSLVKTIYTG